MKIYLSGRIKDYPTYLVHFTRASVYLRRRGHIVVNPCELGGEGMTYEEYMKCDIQAMLDCDTIYMLDGWEKSAGARCEHLVAIFCGLFITYEKANSL